MQSRRRRIGEWVRITWCAYLNKGSHKGFGVFTELEGDGRGPPHPVERSDFKHTIIIYDWSGMHHQAAYAVYCQRVYDQAYHSCWRVTYAPRREPGELNTLQLRDLSPKGDRHVRCPFQCPYSEERRAQRILGSRRQEDRVPEGDASIFEYRRICRCEKVEQVKQVKQVKRAQVQPAQPQHLSSQPAVKHDTRASGKLFRGLNHSSFHFEIRSTNCLSPRVLHSCSLPILVHLTVVQVQAFASF